MSPLFTPSNVKLPSMSVIDPLVVPFTTTDAPATGPNSSSTTPVTFPFCWEILVFGIAATVSAGTYPGIPSVPANSNKPTGLKFFNIIDGFI